MFIVNTIRVSKNNTGCDINTRMNVAIKIKQARTDAGLSQAQLGIKCGWDSGNPQSRIGNYEQGKRVPSVPDIAVIAKALNKSVLYFFEEEERNLQVSEPKSSYNGASLQDVLAGKKEDIDLLKRALLVMDDVLSGDPNYEYTAEDKAKAVIGILYSALASSSKQIDRSTALAALKAISS